MFGLQRFFEMKQISFKMMIWVSALEWSSIKLIQSLSVGDFKSQARVRFIFSSI